MAGDVEIEERRDVLRDVRLCDAAFGMDALINPHDLGGACHGMGGRPSVQLEGAASFIDDLALGHRRRRARPRRPSVLAVDGPCDHGRRLERLGEEAGRRGVVGDEGIGTPCKLEGVRKAVPVSVSKIWRSSVDSPLHFVGKSIPVRVPRRIRREVDAAAGRRESGIAPVEQDGMPRIAPDMEP